MPAYEPTTALVVVDVQNDFAAPDGALAVRGGDEIIPLVNAQIALARQAGATIVASQDWHPEHTPHFASDGGIWPVHCVQDSWGAAFHPDLDAVGLAVIRKGADGRDGYSAFSVRDPTSGDVDRTELDALLRGRGIERIVIVGLATDYCVVETACDARGLGYAVEVVSDAIRAVDLEPGDGDRALARMREAGVEVV